MKKGMGMRAKNGMFQKDTNIELQGMILTVVWWLAEKIKELSCAKWILNGPECLNHHVNRS